MFSVSLFLIVLRKLSTHPKPQVSQESGVKSQSCRCGFRFVGLPASMSPLAAAPASRPSWGLSLPGCLGRGVGWQSPPSPFTRCTTLWISPKDTPWSFALRLAITGHLWSMKLGVTLLQLDSLVILGLQGSPTLTLVAKALESGGHS